MIIIDADDIDDVDGDEINDTDNNIDNDADDDDDSDKNDDDLIRYTLCFCNRAISIFIF